MQKNNIGSIIGITLFSMGLLLYLYQSRTKPTPAEPTPQETTAQISPSPILTITQTPTMANISTNSASVDKLLIEDKKLGTGREVKPGDTVSIHYVGTLENGQIFDSSRDRGQPFEAQIGVGQLIKGWDQGIPGMKVGGQQRLTIPYSLAYGEAGIPGTIPPKSTLIFDVELMGIK